MRIAEATRFAVSCARAHSREPDKQVAAPVARVHAGAHTEPNRASARTTRASACAYVLLRGPEAKVECVEDEDVLTRQVSVARHVGKVVNVAAVPRHCVARLILLERIALWMDVCGTWTSADRSTERHTGACKWFGVSEQVAMPSRERSHTHVCVSAGAQDARRNRRAECIVRLCTRASKYARTSLCASRSTAAVSICTCVARCMTRAVDVRTSAGGSIIVLS